MRKSPTIAPRLCKNCGMVYTPTGNSQCFCANCHPLMSANIKRRHYAKKHPNVKPKQKSSEVCCICGGSFSCHFEGNPYCNLHYLRMKSNGTPNLVGRKSTNSYTIDGNTAIFHLRSGIDFFVDANDAIDVSHHSWCISKSGGYVVSRIDGKIVRLHRYLLRPQDNAVVDHINGNPLDNRRNNLRICTNTENARNAKLSKNNSSGATGVSLTRSGKYKARITVNRKNITLGLFDTFDDALAARKAAELLYFGKYAPSASRTQTSTRDSSP